MKVSQVIALAKKWIEETGSSFPGLRGAYLAGSINELGKKELFPPFKDVDIFIVVEDIAQIANPHEMLLYEGILLEAVCFSEEEYRSPETILASANAGSLVSCEILCDPTGFLERLRRDVVDDYAQGEWVAARCEEEKRLLFERIEELDRADSADDVLESLCWAVLYLGGFIAVACLRTPTVRRCLDLTRELLQDRGRPDLQEEILHLWGCAHLEREQVIHYLQECVQAFDRSVEVISTPFVGSYNLHAHTRPYLVDGAYEMISAGSHREAMYWISLMHLISNKAIQNDAPEDDRSHYQGGIDRLQAELGISTATEWRSRIALARSVSEKVTCFADEEVDGANTGD